MKLIVSALIALIPTGLFAQGSQLCHPREVMQEFLRKSYNETLASNGLVNDTLMLDVWADTREDSENSTWTITLTKPDGIACVVAAGKHFQRFFEEIVEDSY